MPRLTPAALRKQITTADLDPIYLVLGDDEYEKSALATEFIEVVDEGLRAFNVERFYGGECSLRSMLDAARTLPMMATRRLVLLLHAERALYPKRESTAIAHDLEAFEAYLESPSPQTTLVVVPGTLDERRRLAKQLLARATVVRCGTLEDIADAQRWIKARIRSADKAIAPEAIKELAERVGPDIGRLRIEVDRLLLFAKVKASISIEDIREVAGPAGAHDDWAVARGIERGQTAVALRELGLALEAGAVPHMVLGQLAWVVRSRLPSVRVPAAVEAVFRTDLALKSSAGDARVLLERLVVELCTTARSGGR